MGKISRNQVRKVFVRLRLSYASGRDLLYGISRYAREHFHWELKLSLGEDATLAPYPAPGEVDGIITSEPLADADSDAAEETPLVVIGTRGDWLGKRMQALNFVRNDDRDIGRYGATYLSGLGRFRSFGFVPTNVPYYCSILRREGFESALAGGRGNVQTYDGGERKDGSEADIAALGDWLEALPKPAAVMAIHDFRATHVIDAAHARGLKIPSQVAVIGVDNDEILCDSTNPQLTSISPNHVHEGGLAAAALDQLMNSRRTRLTRPTPLKSREKTIVERESSAPIPPSVHLAETAMAYIRKNALKGLKARDVAVELKVSRRLLDLRFRECYGDSILNTIIALRIAEAKKRLATSKAAIYKITAACGFPSANVAQTLFKAQTGMTMSDWRRRHARSSQL